MGSIGRQLHYLNKIMKATSLPQQDYERCRQKEIKSKKTADWASPQPQRDYRSYRRMQIEGKKIAGGAIPQKPGWCNRALSPTREQPWPTQCNAKVMYLCMPFRDHKFYWKINFTLTSKATWSRFPIWFLMIFFTKEI